MENTVIICDRTWYNKYGVSYNLKYDKLVKVDFKKNFSEIILEKIYDRGNKVICVIGKDYYENEVESNINKCIRFVNNYPSSVVIRSKGMNDFDFSQFSGGNSFLCFDSEKFNDKNLYREFANVVELQKFFISNMIEAKSFAIYIMKNNKKIVHTETDEDKVILETRKKLTRNKRKSQVEKSNPLEQKFCFPTKQRTTGKPKICIFTDVKGWAWWIKSEYIKKYLRHFYDIDIVNVVGGKREVDYEKYDLFFTYGYSYVSNIRRAPKERRISGITAHRPIEIISPKMSLVGWTHANSVLLYNELKSIHKNCFYVPNGVDSELFKPSGDIMTKNEIVFGHIGKKSPKKGQAEYIEPAINKSGAKYYSHYNNYKTKIPHNKMPEMYRNFDVFLCASKEDGTPCPALEAAASGIPIISNKIGNMPELIENYETGILLEKKDIDLYVDAIKWCQNNPDKVAEMGRNIRKKIETEWTWELMTRNYLRMFDYILQIERDLSYYENPALHHIKGE